MTFFDEIALLQLMHDQSWRRGYSLQNQLALQRWREGRRGFFSYFMAWISPKYARRFYAMYHMRNRTHTVLTKLVERGAVERQSLIGLEPHDECKPYQLLGFFDYRITNIGLIDIRHVDRSAQQQSRIAAQR